MDYIKVLIFLLVLGFYVPVFSALADTWLIDPYYSHGFLIPPVAAYFIWKKRKALKESDRQFVYGAAVLAGGLALYGAGMLYGSLFLSSLSFIAVVFGFVLAFFGRKAAKDLAFPIAFLIFMIPLPYLDSAAIFLQQLTASSSSTILTALGVPVENNGSQIVIENTIFEIGEPCSGLRSIFALMALGAVFAYILECDNKRRLIIFLCALPIAIAANIIRVAVIVAIAVYFSPEVAMQFFHDLSSLVLFLLAVVGLIVISRCLGCRKIRNI